ncbi:class I SAM-dependent methyltransferase [Natronorubrum texcoconense]|uniref:Methyltransferase domain-containing protein n=1 Tax=Natronorubrum texcoconense TaxID=1095776 RepID=A0A1G9C5U7_9EURY|nr:class I SAM-dependent methyltransferase [Natronorubrum texcoconense]SDK46774.1 Methyltransferase domain-containing protein [Natronorubrum texcoconense]
MTDDESPTTDDPSDRGQPRCSDDISPVLRSIIDELSPGRALDVATGTGRNALALAARGWTVDAVDLSSAKLARARERERGRTRSTGPPPSDPVNWILADVDSYCVPGGVYDLLAVSFFDARDRLSDIVDALAPGGVLWYEHYLEPPAGESSAGNPFRFEANELLTACSRSKLTILYYAEYAVGDEPRVVLVARNEDGVSRWRPALPRP